MVRRVLRLFGLMLIISLLAAPSAVAEDRDATPDAAAWRFTDVELGPDQPTVGQVATVQFTVVDENGAVVPGLHVRADLREPTLTFDSPPPVPILSTIGQADDEPGRYQVALALNQAGRWWIEVQVSDGEGNTAMLSRFIFVGAALGVPPATTDHPLFLRADAWGAFYRLDPTTGSLTTLSGQDVVYAGGHWWVTDTRLVPTGLISADYGGTWRLEVTLSDGVTGQTIRTVDLGEIRASVYIGSSDQPAIATSVAMASDGATMYVYWARQLGQGWLARVTAVDVATGEFLHQRDLIGSVGADVFWGQLDVSQDGADLILAEQAVRATSVSGYRLTVLRADTLETVTEQRRIVAPDDPLTTCLLAYPGPTGVVAGDEPLRYSLCTPSGQGDQLALVVWNPKTGTVVHQVSLVSLAGASPHSVYGIAAPDGRHFYALNTASQRIVEIDMSAGEVLRAASYIPAPAGSPSPWDRVFNWIFGMIAPPVSAGIMIDPGVSIAPDGTELYLVTDTSDGTSDGVAVIDTATLQLTGHLLGDQQVAGVIVSPDGRLIARQVGADAYDGIAILDPAGQVIVSLSLPGQVGRPNQAH